MFIYSCFIISFLLSQHVLLLLLPTSPIHLKLLVVPSLVKQPVVITAVGYNIHAFLGDNLLENIQHNYSGSVNILRH